MINITVKSIKSKSSKLLLLMALLLGPSFAPNDDNKAKINTLINILKKYEYIETLNVKNEKKFGGGGEYTVSKSDNRLGYVMNELNDAQIKASPAMGSPLVFPPEKKQLKENLESLKLYKTFEINPDVSVSKAIQALQTVAKSSNAIDTPKLFIETLDKIYHPWKYPQQHNQQYQHPQQQQPQPQQYQHPQQQQPQPQGNSSPEQRLKDLKTVIKALQDFDRSVSKHFNIDADKEHSLSAFIQDISYKPNSTGIIKALENLGLYNAYSTESKSASSAVNELNDLTVQFQKLSNGQVNVSNDQVNVIDTLKKIMNNDFTMHKFMAYIKNPGKNQQQNEALYGVSNPSTETINNTNNLIKEVMNYPVMNYPSVEYALQKNPYMKQSEFFKTYIEPLKDDPTFHQYMKSAPNTSNQNMHPQQQQYQYPQQQQYNQQHPQQQPQSNLSNEDQKKLENIHTVIDALNHFEKKSISLVYNKKGVVTYKSDYKLSKFIQDLNHKNVPGNATDYNDAFEKYSDIEKQKIQTALFQLGLYQKFKDNINNDKQEITNQISDLEKKGKEISEKSVDSIDDAKTAAFRIINAIEFSTAGYEDYDQKRHNAFLKQNVGDLKKYVEGLKNKLKSGDQNVNHVAMGVWAPGDTPEQRLANIDLALKALNYFYSNQNQHELFNNINQLKHDENFLNYVQNLKNGHDAVAPSEQEQKDVGTVNDILHYATQIDLPFKALSTYVPQRDDAKEKWYGPAGHTGIYANTEKRLSMVRDALKYKPIQDWQEKNPNATQRDFYNEFIQSGKFREHMGNVLGDIKREKAGHKYFSASNNNMAQE
jgi:hypothetical protein